MRTILLTTLLTGLLLSGCGSKTGTTLSGTISQTDAIALTQVEDINRKKVKVIGEIEVKPDGSFSQTFENLEPHLYELNFKNGKKFQFVSEGPGELVFTGDSDKPDEISIAGSEENEVLAGYEKFRKESLARLVLSVRKQIEASPEKSGVEFERLGKLEVSNYTRHKEELVDYAAKNMTESLALYATSVRWPGDVDKVQPLVTKFASKHPSSPIAKRLNEKLEILKQTSVGGKVADIRMRDETGTEITLYQTKRKYTLIDFWGSWCGPCRREAVLLSESYAKYKPLGFEIYGVALESDMAAWKGAKETDKRVWPNVLSMKEFETDAAYDYAVTALPANFLIDENGNVVARDIHDEELSSKLNELFGE